MGESLKGANAFDGGFKKLNFEVGFTKTKLI